MAILRKTQPSRAREYDPLGTTHDKVLLGVSQRFPSVGEQPPNPAARTPGSRNGLRFNRRFGQGHLEGKPACRRVASQTNLQPKGRSRGSQSKLYRADSWSSKDHRARGLKILGLGLIVLFGIRIFVAEAGYVPSGSMKPTIQENDQLIVDKFSYHLHPLQRYDIVALNPTASLLRLNFRMKLIKRIIGLPGDQVQVQGGRVYINQQPLQEDYIAAEPNYTGVPKLRHQTPI